MQVEQFKLLNAARAMASFTIRDLAEQAGVNLDTAKTVLRRRDDLFELTGEKRKSVNGTKASNVYRIKQGARSEVIKIVDESRAVATPAIIDSAEAAAAFANSHNRWRVRRHLAEARDLEPGDERAKHVKRAEHWFRQEKWRIGRFSIGITPPSELLAELETLELQLGAAEVCADRLDQEPEVLRLDRAAAWIARGFNQVFENEGRCIKSAFAPLQIDAQCPAELVNALVKAIRGSGVSCAVPTERLTLATLAALPRLSDEGWQGRKPLQSAQDLIYELGTDALGTALNDQLHGHDAYSTPWVRNIVRDILLAFTLAPALLGGRYGSSKIALWYSMLRGTSLWHESHSEVMVAAGRYFQGWSKSHLVAMVAPTGGAPAPETSASETEIGEIEPPPLDIMPALERAQRYATRVFEKFIKQPVFDRSAAGVGAAATP